MKILRYRLQEGEAGAEGVKASGGSSTVDPKYTELETKYKALEAEHGKSSNEAKTTKEQLETAKRYLGWIASQKAEADQEVNNKQEVDREAAAKQRIVELMKDDPARALDEHFVMRLGPVLDEHLSNQVPVMKSTARSEFIDSGKDKEARAKNQELWDKYAPEIDEFMNGFSSDVKGRKAPWLEGFKMVRARHIDEELAAARDEVERRHTGKFEGRGETPGQGRPKRALTSDEKTMAKEFGMSDDDWREYGGGAGAVEDRE